MLAVAIIGKLHQYGIQGSTLVWIHSFLSNRSQRVVVDGEMSSTAPVTSGVPQGSVLGPILFLCYINDLPTQVTSRCRLFADDSILYRDIKTPGDAVVLQEDLNALARWEERWGMQYHPDKCTLIRITRKKKPSLTTYTLRGHQLEVVDQATYLGVEISANLSWNKHIAKVKTKANRTLGFIKRNITTSSIKAKSLAYKTLVRPQLEYCATVWNPHIDCLIHNLEMVQRRAARYVFHQYHRTTSVTGLLERLKWETLEDRRHKLRLILTYKILHNIVAIPPQQYFKPTRYNQLKFQTIHAVQLYHKASFFIQVIPLWNSCPPSLVGAESLDEFRREMASFKLP